WADSSGRAAAAPPARASMDAVPDRDLAGPPERRRDRRPDARRGQRVGDLRVGPGLGEDDAADGPVREHERAAAVALLDPRAQLEDPSRDVAVAVDVTGAGRVGVGDRRRLDVESKATREAERRPARAAARV